MASYDYKAGKDRINDILDNELEVIEQDKLPNDENFTYTNAYYSWVSAIFVDIRDSSSFFSNYDKENISKIIRSFSSEIIEILRKPDILREIGIRGDCVYAVYTTPSIDDVFEVLDMSFYINTFIDMLNELLTQKDYQNIEVGIGLSAARELVVKAGRKTTGINSKVWIGDAVAKASNLSSIGSKNGYSRMVVSDLIYINTIDKFVERNGEDSRFWFREKQHEKYGIIYDASIVKKDFNNWIKNGMQ